MGMDPFNERLAQILAAPPELTEYRQWLAEQRPAAKGERDYLFTEQRSRFEPRKEDVVVPLPGLQVRKRGGTVGLHWADPHRSDPPADVALPSVSRREAERLIGAMDGERCMLEVGWDAGVKPATLARFLRATFGLVVFAPAAVQALESQLSGLEITRYPGSPYGIVRPYWENMIVVRDRINELYGAWGDGRELCDRLRELHVMALMGRTLESFYKPASPGADRGVAPGALLHDEPRLLETARGTLFLDGPRVKAPLLGGDRYQRALFDQLGDPEALAGERELTIDGLSWGRLVTARSERDDQFAPWFCPPRPIEPAHFDRLAHDLGQAARCAAREEHQDLVEAVASFHHGFVRLHPFHCANQCLAMSLVNDLLRRTDGAGIPHLVLDHWALRLSRPAYVELFARAVAAFVLVDDTPARRLSVLQERSRRSFDLVERVAACGSDSELDALLADEPEATQWALLSSP